MKIHHTPTILALVFGSLLVGTANAWGGVVTRPSRSTGAKTSSLFLSSPEGQQGQPEPTSFREAEVLGLRYMQEQDYEQALEIFKKGLKMPGSRPDVIRTKSLAGPSPVGGAAGGTESQNVMQLDEFELQAAHYNMACAHAQLGNVPEVRCIVLHDMT